MAGSNALCTLCPANTFSNFVGAGGATSSAFCQPCPAGFTSLPGSTKCSAIIWTPVTPSFPLTGRSASAIAANATAVAIVGGVACATPACIGGLSELSLGYDVRNGALIETHTAPGAAALVTSSNLTFDRAAQALSPVDGTTVYVFGGMGSGAMGAYPAGVETNLLWTMTAVTGGTPSATLLASCAPAAAGISCPTARKSAGLAYQLKCPALVGDCLVLVGGDKAGQPSADVVWVFDLAAGKWLAPSTAMTNAPPPRTGLVVQASSNSSMVYAFGGQLASGAASNDVFVLSPFNFFDAVAYTEMTNMAAGKYALASSIDKTWGSAAGAMAVTDGSVATLLPSCLNTFDNDVFVTSTGFNYQGQGAVGAFVMIDLGAVTSVDFIHVYVRSDCCQSRNSAFQIWAGNSNASSSVLSPTPPARSFSAPVGAVQLPTPWTDLAVGGPQIVPTPGLRARYIWFVLPGPGRTLTICELQAWQKKPWVWRQLSGLYNAALNGATTQSSTLSGWGDGLALRAVDGLATNNLDNAAPYSVSHTTSNDVPGPWWQVDMGQVVSVQYINVFGRNDCCQGRNQMMKYSIGNSQDWLFSPTCANPPASITPPCYQVSVSNCPSTPNCYTPGMTSSTAPTPYSFQGQTNAPVPAGTQVVVPPGAPLTACYVTFPCQLSGRYLTVWKNTEGQYWDSNIIMLGEVQAIASKLTNMPSPRAFMASTAYGGNIVAFGGSDSQGFRFNDITFFNMLTNSFLPPFTPLGTTPAPRASAVLALLPPATLGMPSNALALFGGFSNAQQLNDFNTLSFPACPALNMAGVQSFTCAHGGTVCYPTCYAGILPSNGANPLVCQLSGAWLGLQPACAVQAAGPVPGVSATAAGVSATVSWTSVGQSGGYFAANSITQYKVEAVTGDVTETYAIGKFPAFLPTRVALPYYPGNAPGVRPGSLYIGQGNWYKLLEKNGNYLQNTGDPNNVTPQPSCNPWPDCSFVTTTNTWDFWNGYLRLDSDNGRNNWCVGVRGGATRSPARTLPSPRARLVSFVLIIQPADPPSSARPRPPASQVRQQRQHGAVPRLPAGARPGRHVGHGGLCLARHGQYPLAGQPERQHRHCRPRRVRQHGRR